MSSKKQSPIRTILFVSLDKFIASVEEALHPELKGKPVVISDERHGTVTSTNQFAHSMGIRPRMQLFEAHRRAPLGHFIPSSIPRIEQFSKEFFKILARFSNNVEPVALDQAFVDLTGYEYLWISPEYAALKIKYALQTELEITASIGIASNKLCAQIAGSLKKPNGMMTIPWGSEESFLAPISIEHLPGIGSRTAVALRAIGISTIGSLAKLSPAICTESFGKVGATLWSLAKGLDTRAVYAAQRVHSISRSVRLPGLHSLADFTTVISELSSSLGKQLKQCALQSRTVAVRLRTAEGEVIQHQKTFQTPLDEKSDIENAAVRILNEMSLYHQRYMTLSLLALNIQSVGKFQTSAFGPSFGKLKAIKRSVERLQDRYGVPGFVQSERVSTPDTHSRDAYYPSDFRGFVMEGSLP